MLPDSLSLVRHPRFSAFFFNDTATTEIYTLSLHDALPIYLRIGREGAPAERLTKLAYAERVTAALALLLLRQRDAVRSEEHTSELQSLRHLVCRLLLEKKKKKKK